MNTSITVILYIIWCITTRYNQSRDHITKCLTYFLLLNQMSTTTTDYCYDNGETVSTCQSSLHHLIMVSSRLSWRREIQCQLSGRCLQLFSDETNKLVFDDVELHDVSRLLSHPELVKLVEQIHYTSHTHTHTGFIRLRGSRTPHFATSHNLATSLSYTNFTSQPHKY